MKIIAITTLIIVLLIVLVFFYLALKSRTAVAPGIQQGQLLSCPASPNCISSEDPVDLEHYITPVELPGGFETAILPVCEIIINDMGGVIQHLNNDYLAATFSSPVLGFVDDFEIRIDQQTLKLHLRSASRVGHSDFGINRKRAALFKLLLIQQLDKN